MSEPVQICRHEYPARDLQARIIRCGLPVHGRDREHEEADTGVTWPWAPLPPRRVWELPPEPGPEVTRLTAVGGDLVIERDEGHPTLWIVRTITGVRVFTGRWVRILDVYGPLTDTTPGGE